MLKNPKPLEGPWASDARRPGAQLTHALGHMIKSSTLALRQRHQVANGRRRRHSTSTEVHRVESAHGL
eukprot:492357-Pyramimonas_sp.AAC.1